MRRAFQTFLAMGLVSLLPGCAMTFDATNVGVPVTMASPGGPVAEGQRFVINSSAVYAFWGAVPLKQPSLKEPLEQQLLGGKGVTDLKIKVKSKWYQVMFTVITVGLLVPRTVTYEGVITP